MIETWTARGPGSEVEQPVCLFNNSIVGRNESLMKRRRYCYHHEVSVSIAPSSNLVVDAMMIAK